MWRAIDRKKGRNALRPPRGYTRIYIEHTYTDVTDSNSLDAFLTPPESEIVLSCRKVLG